MPMLAAAGMVVTEMRTPMSAPDLAVDRESILAAPAHAATKRRRVRAGDDRGEAWSSSLNVSGARPVDLQASVARYVAVMAIGQEP
jgi:hypothetical protein